MKYPLILILLLSVLTSCGQNNCPPDINKKPMYGQVKKCPQQIQADNEFLGEMDKIFKGKRAKAAQDRVDRAWGYFYENQPDSAMMRFNQAWLLDSTNAEIYWGYGNLLGQRQKFEESLIFFEKSLTLDPKNSNVWLSASTSYGQLFFQTKDKDQLNKSIEYLKKSVELDPKSAVAYGQLTAAYTYFMQKDSARKYLEIADRLDATVVNPEVREILKNK